MSQYVGAACLTMWTPRVIARCAEFRFRRRDQSIESMREPHSQRSHRIGGTPAMANNFCCGDHPRRMLRVCRSRHRQQRLQDKSRCARESARIRSTTCASSLDSSVTQTGHKRFSSCEATEDADPELNSSNDPSSDASNDPWAEVARGKFVDRPGSQIGGSSRRSLDAFHLLIVLGESPP